MDQITHKKNKAASRKYRVRTKVIGTQDRPRLSVHISNRNVFVQVINDEQSKTLVALSTVGKKAAGSDLTTKAQWAGSEIGKKARTAKIKKVVFDRGSQLYHGRVQALADAARKAGLEF